MSVCPSESKTPTKQLEIIILHHSSFIPPSFPIWMKIMRMIFTMNWEVRSFRSFIFDDSIMYPWLLMKPMSVCSQTSLEWLTVAIFLKWQDWQCGTMA